IEVDSWTLIPFAGDRILLCSDGLTNEVAADRIASTLRQYNDPQEVARDLVRQARAHGGNDNITVVVVDVVDDGGRAERASAALGREGSAPAPAASPTRTPTGDVAGEGGRSGTGATRGSTSASATATPDAGSLRGGPRQTGVEQPAAARRTPPAAPDPAPKRRVRPRRFTWRVALFLAVFLAVLGLGAASIVWYAQGSYFVGIDGNQVAVFKGRPGGFLWFEPELVERKNITVEQILPAAVDDLRAGKEEASKADADRYVNNLQQEANERRRTQNAGATSTSAPPGPGTP
ncbi:MAG: hypothetical protein LC733_11590, partial [Actinobacteria bacterium]|nr:hypothetical protein [Actinomycetota bacterium]